jgi:hypothetical protein
VVDAPASVPGRWFDENTQTVKRENIQGEWMGERERERDARVFS